MFDSGFFILYVAVLIVSIIYRWVSKAYYLNTPENQPAIFWNPLARNILCIGPTALLVLIAILSFWLTSYTWWFLAISFVTLMLISPAKRF